MSGIEDNDWEATKSASDHNVYLGGADSNPQPVTKFCAGCHGAFHADGQGVDPDTGVDNGASPWLRYPADYTIPIPVNMQR